MESQIQVAQDTRGERVKHVSGWYFVGSQFFYLCEKNRTQVRSRQICHEDVKFYTIANGMCVGQCEGSTLCEVAVNERVRIAHVVRHSRSPRNMMVQ